MTWVEAFTQGKDPNNPISNEDRFVVVPDRLYAVIDGATDKTGQLHDGLTGGQIAGRVIEDVLRSAVRDLDARASVKLSARVLLQRVNRRLARLYRLYGIADAVRRQPWRRFSAQFAVAVRAQNSYHFVVVGDAGLRLNGREVFSCPHPGDRICAQLRATVHEYLVSHGSEFEQANFWSRACVVEGLAKHLPCSPALLRNADLAVLRSSAAARSRALLPGIPADLIDTVLAQGLKGLHRYRNRIGPLGFASVDGSMVPAQMIVEFERPAAGIGCIELFSDGYPTLPEHSVVAEWEAQHQRVEREDPQRLSVYPGTKGSTAGRFADDRTVLIVHHGGTH